MAMIQQRSRGKWIVRPATEADRRAVRLAYLRAHRARALQHRKRQVGLVVGRRTLVWRRKGWLAEFRQLDRAVAEAIRGLIDWHSGSRKCHR